MLQPVDRPGSWNTRPRNRTLLAAGLLALVFTALYLLEDAAEFEAWIASLGVWGPALFMAAYALCLVALVPAGFLTLTAGALFDFADATLYVLIAATIGSGMAFLVARYLARDLTERWLSGHPRFREVDRAIGRDGFRLVFLLRLSPVFPFTPLNFLLGLTAVSFRDYMLASVGMVPGTLLYVYYGGMAREVAAVAAGEGGNRTPAEYVMLAIGLLAAAWVSWWIARVARRALDLELPGETAGDEPDEPTRIPDVYPETET
jgi:uncharacterized membrane protein YdjX (TVP38/TMEM64 family)